jgi:pSer/pThr/pTyr-binding forkhead associated (FHA) protein
LAAVRRDKWRSCSKQRKIRRVGYELLNMDLYLVVSKGKQEGQWVHVNSDLFVMGSDPSCQLRCRLVEMGKKHCAIVKRERKYFVRDLDSGGLTYVNDRLVGAYEEWPVHNKDKLVVGPLQFKIRMTEGSLGHRDVEDWGHKSLDNLDGVEEDALWGNIKEDQKPINPADAAAAILAEMRAERGILHGRLRVGLESGITTIRFNDHFLVEEAELVRVKKELYEHVLRPHLRVLLDFKDIRRCSSQAAQMFSGLQEQLFYWGSSMAMCRLEPELRKYFNRLKVLQNVPYFKTKEVALKELW